MGGKGRDGNTNFSTTYTRKRKVADSSGCEQILIASAILNVVLRLCRVRRAPLFARSALCKERASFPAPPLARAENEARKGLRSSE